MAASRGHDKYWYAMTHLLNGKLSGRLASIIHLLACPACRGSLKSISDTCLECISCHSHYPVRAGVPILLPQTMQEPGFGMVSADDPVSRHPYSPTSLNIIERNQEGWVLDLGAGGKHQRWNNVIQVDIFRYPMTDVVATADCLPFRDNAFRAVISQAVFEHLQYPEWTAAEIRRVLQPCGILKIDTAFLQPEHGYPHHFFNATETGLRHWFRDFEIEWSGVEAYQHPKWSLSWFLAVYLDRIGPVHAQVLGATDLGRVLRALERLADGQQDDGDALILQALDALPTHEHRTLAAGVSIHARNPPKTDQAENSKQATPENQNQPDDVRKLIAARKEIDGLRAQLASQTETLVLANDRGNYLAQFFPAFNSLQSLGLRAWAQFKIAAVLRLFLPSRLWFWLRNTVKTYGVERGGVAEPLFMTVIVEPEDPIALINTFFSLTHQTYPGWELLMIERPGQLPAVRRALRDFSRLDQRVKIVNAYGETVSSRLRQVSSLVKGSYVVNLPEGGVLVREAVRSLYTLVRNRPKTRIIVTDFERAPHELAVPMRCYGEPIAGAVVATMDEFSFTVHSAVSWHGRQAPTLSASELVIALAYIPEVLFRQAAAGPAQ